VYSTDPNDVARAGLCSWENIDYWKSLADNYIRNARYNETIFLVQHQEAHEMESNDHFRCYTEEDVRETATMLSEFIRYVKRRACAMPLHDAVRIYNKRYPKTEPSYMLWRDTPTPPLNPDYCWDVACGPWPRTFLYYDMGAQMMFVEGKATPVCIRNYGRDFVDRNYFSEPIIPCVRMVRNTAGIWRRELEFEVNAPAAMPYGVAVWGDFSLYRIGDAPGLVNGKILAPELLFLRYDLQKGVNKLVVKLEGK